MFERPDKWQGEFRAKTVIETPEISESITEYSEKCDRVRDVVDNLHWRIARREREMKAPFLSREINGKVHWLFKVEINIFALQSLTIIFIEDEDSVELIGIKFYDSDDSEMDDLT